METLRHQLRQNITSQPQRKKQNSFFEGMTVQRKLAIGAVNDPYEVEADRVADQVVGMSDSQVQPQTAPQTNALVQRKCAACEEEQIQKKSIADSITPMIQRKTEGTEGGIASKAITNQINNTKGGGSSMDQSTSSYMESRFGADFSGVRIHTDNKAIQMSRELNAQAFTVGNDIYFNEGKYHPDNISGKHLLAHELTHTLQQGEGIQKKIQRMAACPSHLSSNEETPDGWKSYFGNSCTFHCCFRGILEDRTASPSDPQNECFYDDSGNLVDENHEYAACGGTPNDYDSSSSPLSHTFRDRGGIWEAGWSAYTEARRFASDRDLVQSIGTTSRTQAEPHLGRSSRVTKTGAVWVTIGNHEVLVVATEIAGSRSLRFRGWVNNFFRSQAIARANRIQGSIPVVPSSAFVGLPSSVPNSAATR